jgi:hypothetical protein
MNVPALYGVSRTFSAVEAFVGSWSRAKPLALADCAPKGWNP